MSGQRSGEWKWCLLIFGLAVLHFIVVMCLVVAFHPPITAPPAPPGTLGRPSPRYDAMVNVAAFPASLVLRAMPLRPEYNCYRPAVIVASCRLWGCIWAEPFRRMYGWQHWRFTTRDLLILTRIFAALLDCTSGCGNHCQPSSKIGARWESIDLAFQLVRSDD
jgi:hypothetical protein